MPFSIFLEIPDDSETYAGGGWDNASGWVWRCEIARRGGDVHLTFAFEKSHREAGTIFFLASIHDHAGKLEDTIRSAVGELPEQLVDEIMSGFHVSASGMHPPAHVDLEMRAYLRTWISLQRSGVPASTKQRHIAH